MNVPPGHHLQRPLPDTTVRAIVERGYSHVYGPVASLAVCSPDRGDTLVLELVGVDPAAASRLGANHVDVGVYELQAPRADVTLGDSLVRELPPTA